MANNAEQDVAVEQTVDTSNPDSVAQAAVPPAYVPGTEAAEDTKGVRKWLVEVVWPYGSLASSDGAFETITAGNPVEVDTKTKDAILDAAGVGRVVVTPVTN